MLRCGGLEAKDDENLYPRRGRLTPLPDRQSEHLLSLHVGLAGRGAAAGAVMSPPCGAGLLSVRRDEDIMKFNNFLTLATIIALIFGLAFLIAPSQLTALYGVNLTPATEVLGRI